MEFNFDLARAGLGSDGEFSGDMTVGHAWPSSAGTPSQLHPPYNTYNTSSSIHPHQLFLFDPSTYLTAAAATYPPFPVDYICPPGAEDSRTLGCVVSHAQVEPRITYHFGSGNALYHPFPSDKFPELAMLPGGESSHEFISNGPIPESYAAAHQTGGLQEHTEAFRPGTMMASPNPLPMPQPDALSNTFIDVYNRLDPFETAITAIEVCPASDGLIELESVNPIKPRKRKRDSTDLDGNTRTTHTDDEWKKRRDHISHLRLEKDHTASELAFEMSVIYGFEAKEATYNKRFKAWKLSRNNVDEESAECPTAGPVGNAAGGGSSRAPRHRSAQSLKWIQQLAESLNMTSSQVYIRFRNQKSVETPARVMPSPYVHQETMLHEIEGLTKHFFGGRKTENWTIDHTGDFVAPGKKRGPGSDAWCILSDRMTGLVGLAGTGTSGANVTLLWHLVLRLDIHKRAAVRPTFMVHFWRICLTLSEVNVKIRHKLGRSVFVYAFLLRLHSVLIKRLHAHALVQIVEALLQTMVHDSQHFKPAVVVAYWKSIHALQHLVGNENPLVLSMGVHCAKALKSRFATDPDRLQAKYRALMGHTGPGSTEARVLAIQHDSIYAQWQGRFDAGFPIDKVERLRDQALTMCRMQETVPWDAATRALHFATDVLQKHYRNSMRTQDSTAAWNAKHDLVRSYLEDAIAELGRGDLESQLHAATLSREMARWIKSVFKRADSEHDGEYYRLDSWLAHAKENVRTRNIVLSIRGVMMPPTESETVPLPRVTKAAVGGKLSTRHRRQRTKVRDALFGSIEKSF